MIRLGLALTTLVLALALPSAYGAAVKPNPQLVAGTVLAQINSGPDGRITRHVTCAAASRAVHAFACELESVRSTHIGAHVTVVDGALRTTWRPLAG